MVSSLQARIPKDAAAAARKSEDTEVHGGVKRKRSVGDFFITRQQQDRCKALADFIFGHAGSVPLSMVEAPLFKRFLKV